MKFLLTLFLIFSSLVSFGQANTYWQQQVNYKISANLDDANNFLRGNIEIEYTNNSPDTLHFIKMHLWPNAYKNNSTAFAKQEVENGSTDFYYAAENDHGFIDSLNFVVMGMKVKTIIDSINIDIATVYLPVPLYPNKKIIITTPFRVKIPKTFSRMGHIGQQYQISQWYPKPAVYDQYGWHAMPYLDQGEFYSEFGKFDVEITLPKNYVVGATGVLQNESEKIWLDSLNNAARNHLYPQYNKDGSYTIDGVPIKTLDKNYFPPSNPKTKTLHYTAENVHDFAWFADKRYNVVKGSVALPDSKKEVTTWVMFTNDVSKSWSSAITSVDSAVYYYSKWIGDYPYPQATAVYGALEAGGGMEYPMITVISGKSSTKDLDAVIAHEVGHNWLYGILAFNEREHPWMDEGINSFYENRYVETRYPNENLIGGFSGELAKAFDLDYPHHYGNYLFYNFMAAPHKDQPMDENAALFTSTNYGAIVYAKTPEVFRYLENYLGKEIYDSLMHEFYLEWKFKHPYPEDLKKFFEQKTKKDFDWLFNQLIATDEHLDYKLKKEEVGLTIGSSSYSQLVVKNIGEVKGPYSIAAFKDKIKVGEIWYGGFTGKMTVTFPEGDFDYFRIDPDYNLPEVNRKNNFLKRKGIFKTAEPLRLQWLASIDNPRKTQLFFTPLMGGNHYDGFTPGLALYNSVIVPHKINFILVPQIGLRSGSVVGLGAVNVPFYLKDGFLHSIDFTSSAKSYNYGTTGNVGDTNSIDLRYSKFAQTLSFNIRKKNPRNSVDQKLKYQNIFFNEDPYYGTESNKELLNLFSYSYTDGRILNPFHFYSTLELGNGNLEDYAKIYLKGTYTISYPKKKQGLDVSAFAGIMIFSNNGISSFHLSASSGTDDYRYENVFLGRSETEGFLSQQISMNDDGGMAMRTTGVQPRIGSSNSWILAINLKARFPFFMPLFVFADGGFAPNDYYDVFQYDGGIGLTLIPDIIEVYLPVFYSSDISTNLISTPFYDKWYKTISFTFNIERANPFELIKNIKL